MSKPNHRSATNSSRRSLIKKTGVAGGVVLTASALPESWVKPIIKSMVLPAHAQTSVVGPPSCLVAATYCEGSGMGSIRVTVEVDGMVTVVHPNGTASTTVDTQTGGSYSVDVLSNGGNTITLSGSIPCGNTDSITLTEASGMATNILTLNQNLC